MRSCSNTVLCYHNGQPDHDCSVKINETCLTSCDAISSKDSIAVESLTEFTYKILDKDNVMPLYPARGYLLFPTARGTALSLHNLGRYPLKTSA